LLEYQAGNVGVPRNMPIEAHRESQDETITEVKANQKRISFFNKTNLHSLPSPRSAASDFAPGSHSSYISEPLKVSIDRESRDNIDEWHTSTA
jgi:hypothetical protein